MGPSFYGAVTNLYRNIGVAAYVLSEKLMPAGQRLAFLIGSALIAWGAVAAAAA